MPGQREQYSRGRVVGVLSIVLLSLLDAFFTIHLVQNGATELNPILSYYLEHGFLAFFVAKYFLTTAAIFITLATENLFGPKLRLPANLLFAFYALILTMVVYWEAYLAFL